MIFSHLDYFIVIVEEGTLAKAAARLFVSQPSLSLYIRKLEKALQIELFDHTQSPLQLTYAGRCFYNRARQIRDLEETTRRELSDIKSHQKGRIRLGIPLWRSAALIPDVFPSFHKRYPLIQLELMEAPARQLEKALAEDRIDIMVANIPSSYTYGNFLYEQIFLERILLAVPAEHTFIKSEISQDTAFAKGIPKVSPKILGDIPLVLTSPGQAITKAVEYYLSKHKISPEILLRTSNLTMGINLVARGIACTFVPEEGLRICRHPGKVLFCDLDSPDLTWSLSVIYKKDVYLSALSKLFINHLKACLNDEAGYHWLID